MNQNPDFGKSRIKSLLNEFIKTTTRGVVRLYPFTFHYALVPSVLRRRRIRSSCREAFCSPKYHYQAGLGSCPQTPFCQEYDEELVLHRKASAGHLPSLCLCAKHRYYCINPWRTAYHKTASKSHLLARLLGISRFRVCRYMVYR